jgi:hypothetical protein
MIFRSKKLRDAAQHYNCVLCGASGTTVAAHANSHKFGKGMGIKSEDMFCSYVCQYHHDVIDGRQGHLGRDERQQLWIDAWIKTVRLWFHEGIVVVK